MADVGSANVNITADDSSAKKTVSGFFGFLKNSASSVTKLVGGFAIFDTIKSGIIGAAKSTIGANAEMESYKNTLTTVLKSSDKATQTLAWAQKFAAKTPFEIPGIVEATTRLSSYGINAQSVLGNIGDMAAVMGKPLMQAVEAVADAQTGELERLKEFGITKKMLIDKAAKMGAGEIVNAKGQITNMKGLNNALFALMQDRFKGGMALQSQTFNGMISNVKDAIGTMGRELSKPLFEKFKQGLASILPIMSGVTQLVQGDTIGFITTITQAFGPDKEMLIIKFFLGIRNGGIAIVDTFNKLKPVLIGFFVGLKPSIDNLMVVFNNLKPLLGDIGKAIGASFVGLLQVLPPILEKITAIAKAVTGWSGFIPLITGIVSSLATYEGAVAAVTKAQAIYKTVTDACKLAQNAWTAATAASTLAGGGLRGVMAGMKAAALALNLTMLANPFVLISTLVIGLGVAFYELYQHSETFRNGVNNLWANLKTFFSGIETWRQTTSANMTKFWSGMGSDIAGYASKLDKWHSDTSAKTTAFWSNLNTNTENWRLSTHQKIANAVTDALNWFDNLHASGKAKVDAFYHSVAVAFTNMANSASAGARNIVNFFVNGWNTLKSNTETTFSRIKSSVSTTISNIATAAGEIPGKIGSAISKKVGEATNAMANLASSLITRFKKALGISSPSKVFYEMAGHIVSGLTNGLSASNLKDLGKNVFSDFAGGALKSFDLIKGFLSGGFNTGKASGAVSGWLKTAMAITKTPMSWLSGLSTIAMKESGGNSKAVNNWDSNAKKGTPSMGLMQTIMPTFQRFAKKGMSNILNPIDNAVAAINYIKSRYGSIFNVPGILSMMRGGAYKGYAKGGFFLNGPQMGMFGEGGPEMALPLIGRNMLPYAQAVAGNLSRMFGGTFGAQQEVHNHYWNVNADEINEVSKLVRMVNSLRQDGRRS